MSTETTGTARWHGHPVAARLIRIAIFVVPFMTAMGAAFVLSTRLPVSSSLPISMLRWFSIVAVSTVAMTVVDRVARRFLPLSALLRLTLVFPDQAPSRFAVAMRTGTTAQLRRRLEAAREVPIDETPQQAAERLLDLVALLSQHDRLTRGHSERVRAYAHLIGDEMGLTESELDKLRWAALLHDVGKTAISTEILNKPGTLTDAEYDVIKTHPDEGRGLVDPLAEWLGDSVRAVWEHHERFDGAGYPRGLAGTEISFAARVVSVADSYDVMTSARSYKKPMSAAAARAELAACSGTQFDPIVVRSFLNVSLGRLRLMTGPLAWVAQLALFEPSGVVHAGSASIQSGGSTVSASAVGSAASASTTGVASTVAATAASVVVSTAGIVAAAPPMMDTTETVAVVQTSERGVDVRGDLGSPADTVVVVGDDGTVVFESATTRPVAQTDAFVLDDTRPGPPTDEPEQTAGIDATTADENSPVETRPPAAGSTTTSTSPTRSTTTTTASPSASTTTTTTTTTTSTTTTTAPTTTTTTTTGPTTTTSTTVPAGAAVSRWYLGGDVIGTTDAPLFHNLVSTSPPDVGLSNLDADRDDFPGVVVAKDSAGVTGSDPTKVLTFAGGFATTLDIDDDVRVELYGAAKDFGRKDIDVQVALYRCGEVSGCRLIAVDEQEFRNADRWMKKVFRFDDVDERVRPGQRLEVRVAVLDSSEDDGWFAFGTADHAAQLVLDDDSDDDDDRAADEDDNDDD